jgi:hypothetical protein
VPSVATGAPAVATEQGGAAGGLFNVVGVIAAGVLGGLLYQSNKGQKRVKEEMEVAIAKQKKVC